jgi:hopanoid biosynthesis associated radical SAM protein HpnJ
MSTPESLALPARPTASSRTPAPATSNPERVAESRPAAVYKTLFLQAPSFDGFDGGAGSRYQAKREIKSFWYPTWLAQPAALVPGSRLLDAPADGLGVEDTLDIAQAYELVIIHTSTPSFPTDAKFAELLKARQPKLLIGMIGAKTAVDPKGSLEATPAIDFVCREEFDYSCKEIAEKKPLDKVRGVSYHGADGQVIDNPAQATIHDMDALPFVAPIYHRDLNIDNYYIGYLKHPYVSLYTGRGCRSKCTFCLWPQTVGGHRYRVRSAESVLMEARWIKQNMPEVKELMFDDDTFTDLSKENLKRVHAIARGLHEIGWTWSCNSKANVPYESLKIMKENGLRLLLVGYESGDNQILLNIKKGLRTDIARRFTEDCRKLGILIHGTFILGLPGETRETIDKTIEFAKSINPHTIQVSLAAPYPGTALYQQALENGWLKDPGGHNLVNDKVVQLAAISYPHLSQEEIYHGVERFYRAFYFRPTKIWEIVREMLTSWDMTKRRLREGSEFFHFLHAHAT